MALIAALTRNHRLRARLSGILRAEHELAGSTSGDDFLRLVRERPAVVAVIHLESARGDVAGLLREFRRRFPHTGLVVVGELTRRPGDLFRIGRARVEPLVLVGSRELEVSGPRAIARSLRRGAASLVTARLSRYLPRRELMHVHLALDRLDLVWSAEEFAAEVGITRPVLSERLKAVRLPSVGRLLVWSRLIHAGYWLVEPGRTGESVARQLDYSSGAAFRRALKLYTGATPTEVREEGGLSFVLDAFMEECGFVESTAWDRAQVA